MDSEEDVVIFPGKANERPAISNYSQLPFFENFWSEDTDWISRGPQEVSLLAPPQNDLRPTQISPLLNLPQELKDVVVSHLRREDIARLRRTCRSLGTTTLPFLYQDIALQSTESNKTYPKESTASSRKLDEPHHALLLRTFFESSDLSALVKSLSFRRISPESAMPKNILAFTPNLTTIHYDYFVIRNEDCVNQINAYSLSTALRQVRNTLKHLKITYKADENYSNLELYTYSHGHCSLATMSRLEILEIPLNILLDYGPEKAPRLADVLPRGLIRFGFVPDPWNRGYRRLQQWWDVNSIEPVWDLIVGFVDRGKWKEIVPDLKTFNCVTVFESECGAPISGEESGEFVHKRDREFQLLCKENGLVCERCHLY